MSTWASGRKTKPSYRKLENDFNVNSSGSEPSNDEVEIGECGEEGTEGRQADSGEEEEDEACFNFGSHEAPSDCEDDVNWFQCDSES